MNWPLMDSPLIIFRSPPSNEPCVLCTDNTLYKMLYVTQLAQLTGDIDIACLPNIWSSNYTANTTNSTVLSSISFSPLSTDTIFSDPPSASLSPMVDYELPLHRHIEPYIYDTSPLSRFFVIKSFSEDDVRASVVHGIWTSTRLGNQRLNAAYHESPHSNIYLFFLVNGSCKFCGVARMLGPIDYSKESNIWVEATRWKGIFPVQWLQVQDIPNKVFRYLRVSTNNYKFVTSSRDTQELPHHIGVSMLNIYANFRHLK